MEKDFSIDRCLEFVRLLCSQLNKYYNYVFPTDSFSGPLLVKFIEASNPFSTPDDDGGDFLLKTWSMYGRGIFKIRGKQNR